MNEMTGDVNEMINIWRYFARCDARANPQLALCRLRYSPRGQLNGHLFDLAIRARIVAHEHWRLLALVPSSYLR